MIRQQCKTGHDSVPWYGCRPQLPTLPMLLKLRFLHRSQGRSTFFPGWLIFEFSFPLRHSWNKFISPIRQTSKQLSFPRQIHLRATPRGWNYMLFSSHKTGKPVYSFTELGNGCGTQWCLAHCVTFVISETVGKPTVCLYIQFASRPMRYVVLSMVNWVLTYLPFSSLSFPIISARYLLSLNS